MSGVHALRRDRLRTLLDDRSLLVTSLPNIRYLTGFSGSNAALLITPDETVLGTDGRYRDQAALESPDLPPVLDRDTVRAIATSTTAPFAVEATCPVGSLRDGTVPADVEVIGGLVESLRRVKDADELAALARACAITVAALDALTQVMRPGCSEIWLARHLEGLFADLGAQDRAFDTIVGGGPHSAIPHHQPGRRPLEVGDLVVVDCGARVDGYHADMTRTYVVGREPQPWQAEIHAVTALAQRAASDAARCGAGLRDVDAVARDIIGDAGFADAFTHGLGHGVGLQIHEAPFFGPRATGTIDADMAVTVEPGIYLAGRGGVRIEDTLVVTDAEPRVLTEAPRELAVVG